jgi:SAM-dependent methyltransferase
MFVCPDCRNALPCSCGWRLVDRDGISDYLSSKDRASDDTAAYIETYETLAEKNLVNPTISNRYIEQLARRFIALLNVSGKDFCDVGSGRGYLIREALAQGAKSATAVDIAAASLRDVASRYPVTAILANAEQLPFERHFDVMTATDIVEHVLNVSNFLVTANWSLRDGGILAVRVPYRENMIYYSNFFGLPMHFTHLRTFDRTLLVDLIESGGFKVLKVRYDGFFHGRLHSPLLKSRLIRSGLSALIRSFFEHDDDVTTITPILGRMLMRPVEIGVVARKVAHIEARDVHGDLAQFQRQRQSSIDSRRVYQPNL